MRTPRIYKEIFLGTVTEVGKIRQKIQLFANPYGDVLWNLKDKLTDGNIGAANYHALETSAIVAKVKLETKR